MSTNSRIGIRNPDSTITSIYCHWDGYPENNGVILRERYDNEKIIRKLMKLGDISTLGPDTNLTVAYGRDKDEPDTDACTVPDLQRFLEIGEEYNYLWEDNKWKCFNHSKLIEI